jgi:hypothetical protein
MMATVKRLVETSRGLTLIDLEGPGAVGGVLVSLTAFGADGWEDEAGDWAGLKGQGTLAEFMTTYIKIPQSEAEQLAADVLGPWLDEWERLDGEAARKIRRDSRWFFSGVALVVLLAIVGFVGLVVSLVGHL